MSKITQKQLEANRQNSKLGGVKTSDGKAVSKHNAIKHGIFSKQVVIMKGEGKENLEDFLELQSQLIDQLQPVGVIEDILVDRILTHIWRLRRVVISEVGETRKRLDSININKKITEINREENLRESADGIKKLINLIEVAIEDVETDSYSGPNFDRLNAHFEFGLLSLITLASMLKKTALENPDSDMTQFAKSLFLAVANTERDKLTSLLKLSKQREYLGSEAEHLSANLPDLEILDKISRYDISLERSLYKTINELQKIQAIRLGIKLPDGTAININLNQLNQNN